jgi:hypothetical protein
VRVPPKLQIALQAGWIVQRRRAENPERRRNLLSFRARWPPPRHAPCIDPAISGLRAADSRLRTADLEREVIRVSTSYLHSLEGRLRIKVPVVKSAPERAARLEEHFAGVAAMREVQANPITGNVLFVYDPTGIRERDIMRMLQRLGWIPAPLSVVGSGPARVAPPVQGETTAHRILEKLIAALLEILFLRLLRLA